MSGIVKTAPQGSVVLASLFLWVSFVWGLPAEARSDEMAPANEKAPYIAEPAAEEAGSEEGILNITTDPECAEISLDGNLIGVSPISELAVKVGKHVVKAEHAGYYILEAQVTVEIGEVRELHMELVERLEKSESWWGKNSVYFTIGAIVLGVGVILVAGVGLAAAP
jgi:hypothetical protein